MGNNWIYLFRFIFFPKNRKGKLFSRVKIRAVIKIMKENGILRQEVMCTQ